ncbi:MAG: hypothetical protein ACFFDS_08390, partial [Candidatus Thorarchaeota archaeon]
MKVSEDVAKHLFYTTWVLMVLQMIKVLNITFLGVYVPLLVNIVDAAFDCALILFAIGIIRLGKEIENIRKWMVTSIALIFAGGVDITTLILSYIFGSIGNLSGYWILAPLLYVRLVLLICFLVALPIAFMYIKFHIDDLEKLNIIPRKGRLFIPAGYFLQIFPYLIPWIGDYMNPKTLPPIVSNLGLFFILISAFLIIVGFLELTVVVKMIL